MKITVLAPYSRPHEDGEAEGSGMNQYIRESCEALAKNNHDVTIVVRKSRANDTDFKYTENVHIRFISAGRATRLDRKQAYSALKEDLDLFEPDDDTDLYIAHYWIAEPWVSKVQTKFFGQIVYFSHSFTFNEQRTQPDYEALAAESKLAQQVSWCANTTHEFKVMSKILPKNRCFLVYPGVKAPSEINAPLDEQTKNNVLFLGRMNKAKGFDLFYEASKHLTNITFLAVGRNETKINSTKNLTIRDHVQLSEVFKLLKSADVIVCPSRYEHFGFVPLLAALFNKKIVATKAGVATDLDMVGYNNLFLTEPNTEEVQKAIGAAAEIEAKEFDTARIRNVFSWEAWVDKVIKNAVTASVKYSGKFAHIEIEPKKTDDGLIWYESVTMPGSVHVIPVNGKNEYGFITEVRLENHQPIERILSGSIDKDETPERAAIRELEEETGLKTERLELFYTSEQKGTIRDRKFYYLAHNCSQDGNKKCEKGEKILKLKYYSKEDIQSKILKKKHSATSTIALLSLCGIFKPE